MMTTATIDFLISAADSGDAFSVRIIDSARGRTDSPAAFPLLAAADGFSYAGAALPASLDQVTNPQTAGELLYSALTTDSRIRELLAALLAENETLRLRFQVEPRALRPLPWELLYTDPYGFLCLAASITRYIAVTGQPVRALLTEPPLTILLVSAAPSGFPALDIDKEIGQIRGALGDDIDAGRVRLVECPDLPIESLRATALDSGAHVVHFIGHADFNEGKPVIVFAGADGRAALVSAETLGVNLAGLSALRLAVLNACETAVEGTGDAFVGIAPKLIQRAGLPAVLAMQSKILDSSAVAFSHGFYAALGRGDSIDRAVSAGRLGIFNRHSGSDRPEHRREFIVPVLFVRPADSTLVMFPQTPIPSVAARDPQSQLDGWRDRIAQMAAVYARIDAWKTLHETLHDLDGILDLIALDLGRTEVDRERLRLTWRQAALKLDALRLFAANAPISETLFRLGDDGTLTGDPWVVEVLAAARSFERELDGGLLRGLRRSLRDLRRAVATHLNTSDKAIADSLSAFPTESIWTEGAPTPALQTLVESINQQHRTLVTTVHRHDLLQDLLDVFRRVRQEARTDASPERLDSLNAAWDFARASVIDSRLLPYVRANHLLVEAADGTLTGDAWAVELFTTARRLDAAIESALDTDDSALIGEALRGFDSALNRYFLSTDSQLRQLTAELRGLGAQLSALVARSL